MIHLTWKHIFLVNFAHPGPFLISFYISSNTTLWPRDNILLPFGSRTCVLCINPGIDNQTTVPWLSPSSVHSLCIIGTFERFGKVRKLWAGSCLFTKELAFFKSPQFNTFLRFLEGVDLVIEVAWSTYKVKQSVKTRQKYKILTVRIIVAITEY